MIAGYDERSRLGRDFRQRDQDEPLVLGSSNVPGDAAQRPGRSACSARGSLDLNLDRRAMSQMRTNSQDVSTSDAITGKSRRPAMPRQGCTHPVLPDRFSHFSIHHDKSISHNTNARTEPAAIRSTGWPERARSAMIADQSQEQPQRVDHSAKAKPKLVECPPG